MPSKAQRRKNGLSASNEISLRASCAHLRAAIDAGLDVAPAHRQLLAATDKYLAGDRPLMTRLRGRAKRRAEAELEAHLVLCLLDGNDRIRAKAKAAKKPLSLPLQRLMDVFDLCVLGEVDSIEEAFDLAGLDTSGIKEAQSAMSETLNGDPPPAPRRRRA